VLSDKALACPWTSERFYASAVGVFLYGKAKNENVGTIGNEKQGEIPAIYHIKDELCSN
jgi:hypothetical protein